MAMVDSDQIAIIGYCFGGTIALVTSIDKELSSYK